MTDPATSNPTPAGAPALDEEALARIAAQLGQDPEALRSALLPSQPATPLVRDLIADYLAIQTSNTRRTYGTPLHRLRDGLGPVCDQTCELCLGPGFVCRCGCAACRSSRVTIPPHGDLQVSGEVFSAALVRQLATVTRRMAVKKGIVDNRRRATRGQVAKSADGYGAEETTVAALRSLFEYAKEYCGGVNHAKDISKPRRTSREKRPLRDFEVTELHLLTGIGGDDPELDSLILDFGLATGVRREGVYGLTIGQVHVARQVIDLRDKYKKRQPCPVSLELVQRLAGHAKDRGGDQCDPQASAYRPDAPVFYFKNGAPLTSRRIDTLVGRWQRELSWANEEQLGFHHLRHTMAAILETEFGPQYKRRYLRHADGNVTDKYGVCTFEQLALALSNLLEFQHPLVHGIDERRRETMLRLGLSDDD